MDFGATVSDLHVFSHHSRSKRYLARIQDTAADAKVFVLNGDIFDFKWSEHGVFSRSVTAARLFIKELVEGAPNCQFLITLGNHDAVPPYMEALDGLAEEYENLAWHEFACRVGDRIFLHGDVIHAGCTNDAIRKFRSKLQRPANGHALQRMAHSAVHRSHVSSLALRMVPKRMLASRIIAYLEHEQWLNGNDVRHIYFGHTHNHFEDFKYHGFSFHNCGAATHGARLRVVRFPLQGDSL
jgi:UDP-2,3-diacylglucosamine hydrolase